MPTIDEELQAYYEELERQRQQSRKSRIGQAVKSELKRRGVKEVKRRVGAYLAPAVAEAATALAAAATAAAPYIGVVLLIIAVIAGFILLTVVVIAALCNTGGVTGALIQGGSSVLGLLGVGGDICEQFSGISAGIGGALERGQNLVCTNTQIIAQQFATPHPYPGNDPDLGRLIECIRAAPGIGAVGSVFTGDSNAFCNYSRGSDQYEGTCGACAHSQNSCHYGGSTGQTGSMAVDFGGQAGAGNAGIIGPQILQAAQLCSGSLGIPLKRATCENSSGEAVACLDPSATHVHISLGKCDRDNGPINTR